MNQSTRKLDLEVLNKLEETISKGDINSFKKLTNLINCRSDIDNQINLSNYYDNASNPLKRTNFVILACKYNKVKILKHILDNNAKILSNLSTSIKTTILPHDEDEVCHNAFYYAIRSGSIELLNTLINKWPDNYFVTHFDELDELLSKAYEELKLKNIPLLDEMEMFVENKLINLRFFSNTSRKNQNVTDNLNNIRERIELVLENINLLKTEYSNTRKVDYKFLFIAKFIAQNIDILKHQLKSMYDRLPWEEIEFCLISFVCSYTKQEEINIFSRVTLTKDRLLQHLGNFAKKLENEKNIIDKNICKLDLSKLKREEVIAKIISNYPNFKELYIDYEQIRDIHSLTRISEYANLAISADPNQREGQLIIARALQVIGEYLKNTLESPKLSSTTSNLFALSLSNNTRKVVIDLRNSLSHAFSLSKRMEIEDNRNANFFIGIQDDTRKIANVISDILNDNKNKMIIVLLNKIINSKSIDEIKEVSDMLSITEYHQIMLDDIKMLKDTKLEKLIKELSDNIPDKTCYEMEIFNKIKAIFSSSKVELQNTRMNYSMGFMILKSIGTVMKWCKKNHNVIRGLKNHANKILPNIVSERKSANLKEIVELSVKIFDSAISRLQESNINKMHKLIWNILYIAKFETGDVKWIENLTEKLKEKSSFTPLYKSKIICNVTREMYNNQFLLKLEELKSTLKNNGLSEQLIEKLPTYKKNKHLQAVIEMLVLDIMSILSCSGNYFENDLLFLDNSAPLLTGKCLRNHLAHDNVLVNILLSDPSVSIILNARKLTIESIIGNKKKLGKQVMDSPSKLKDKYNQNLVIITNQESMFIALEEGNLEDFKSYLKKGGDVNARSIDLWTTLHFAAKGSNLESIKFILEQNVDVNAKNINGQSALHIAAAYGRTNTVEYFLTKTDLYIDDEDNESNTPLHLAAQNGHKDIVTILLKNNANTGILNKSFLSALYCAIQNNHIDIVKMLLKKQEINESISGFTPLYIAVENGYLEIVNFLLENGANVHAINENRAIPLHVAALNGHLEVVNALILKGTNVNSSTIDGCTPLHHAIENGHEEIVNILLKHGANANAANKTYNNTPLHYAARDGHYRIVNSLLKNKANTDVTTVEGLTPLHMAIFNGHFKIVSALFKHEVHTGTKIKDNKLLHCAAAGGHKEIAEFLIRNGAEINVKDENDMTPLYIAVKNGHKDIIDLLIKNKANINVQRSNGATLLHEAVAKYDPDIVDLLIKYKAEVNARVDNNLTPLHVAATFGKKDIVELLIKNKAEINAKCNRGMTPLHAAIVLGRKDIVNLLIKNKAEINDRNDDDITPLDLAVQAGQKEIVEDLIANGANVNMKNKNCLTPLATAIKCNNKEILEVLIANGATINVDCTSKVLEMAVYVGYQDILQILIRNNANINIKSVNNLTLLHIAAERGHEKIVNALIASGANVDAVTTNNITPLYLAAQEGNEEIIEILITNGSSINTKSNDGTTPLHIAAAKGCNNVVKILLNNKANVKVKDNKNRTALELAVSNDHLEVVKMLLQHEKVDINAKGNDDWTILHIASQSSNLEMVKFLVDKGADINVKNAFNSKPVHIAAREGHKDIVEFFLSRGSSINDLGGTNQTLLHYATMKGQLKVVEYLIARGADTNAQDANGSTPMHMAAHYDFIDVIKVLLENGTAFNIIDHYYLKPLQSTNNKSIINILTSTEKLFDSVKCNNISEVENYIKAGAFVNAKNANIVAPLHYAAWKGYDKIVDILLQNKANLNTITDKGLTPLHYAAKFSHLQIVKVLLSNGAIYNAISNSGKTPLDFTVDKDIIYLFNLLNVSFKNIKNNNPKVINELNKINDVAIIRAIMNACDRENRTLVVAAVHSNYSKIEELKEISQGDISMLIKIALKLIIEGNYQRALSILKSAFEKRKEILGPDNPGTLDIQRHIATVLYKQAAYHEALNMFEEIFQKQERILGSNNKDTLITRSSIALTLHKLGKNEKASNIFQENYQKQKEILGPNHSDTINTQFHMALVLNSLGKFTEALKVNEEVFKKRAETLGTYNIATVSAQNNIAMVLANTKEYKKALQIYQEVFEKKKVILGINHSDTLRTLSSIAEIFSIQSNYFEAIKTVQKVLDIQQNVFGQNHPETLNTQYLLGNIFLSQGNLINAYKAYRKCYDQKVAMFGPNNPAVLDILTKMEMISLKYKFDGSNSLEILQHLQRKINIAASNGDTQTVQRLLKDGADVNDKDDDGRTPLHYAVSNGQANVVNILLKSGADIMQVTNKGNTPLHVATSKNDKEIVKLLLEHVTRDKLNYFVNAKTSSSGATSLHVAAKNGCLEIVILLLKHGASFEMENKEGKKPINLSKNQSVSCLLNLIEELFKDAVKGNVNIINKLKAMKPDEFLVATNARDNHGNTLLRVTICFQYKNITSKLLEMIKSAKSDQ